MFVSTNLWITFHSLSNLAAGAGLTGFKMARRTGSVDEFEFKAIGENHNQGVSIFLYFHFLFAEYYVTKGVSLSPLCVCTK